MRAKQSILGLVYTGGEVRRPPLVGMQISFMKARGGAPADFVAPRPRLQAKGSDRPPRPSFCRSPPGGSAPLPHFPCAS